MHLRLAQPSASAPHAAPAPAERAASAPAPAPAPARSLGPDLVRAVAALLVVYLHAGVPYLTQRMPGLVWPVKDVGSPLVSALFWTIELFIMPLFLVLAGYYGYRSWAVAGGPAGGGFGRGGAKLIASRGRRLLVPLVIASVVLLPLEYYLWIVGWVIEGDIRADRLWKLKVRGEAAEHLFGLAHLWFLQYVFLYCLVWVVAVRWGRSERLARYVRAATRSVGTHRLIAAGCAAIGASVLVVAPQVVYGFQHAFLPVPSKWLYSGTFFFGGMAVAAFDPQWLAINRLTPRLLAAGLLGGAAAVPLGQWAIERSDFSSLAFAITLPSRIVLAVLTVTAAWGLSLGGIGLANRLADHLAVTRPRVAAAGASLAAAGLWIYLVHHPLVALLHIDLKLLFPTLAPLAKSLIAAAGAVLLSLASYHGVHLLSRRGRGEVGATAARRVAETAGIAGVPATDRDLEAAGEAAPRQAPQDQPLRRAA